MTARNATLVWLGVLAAPAAWCTQFVVGQWLSEAACRPAGNGLSPHSWTVPATAVAALVAVSGGLCALHAFRLLDDEATDDDAAPPEGRMRFMAIVGMTTSPLFLCIILLGGLGALSFSTCSPP
jgi:hypothetical protein